MGLFGDLVSIVAAPVKVAAAVTEAVVKPVAEVAKELTEDIENALK